MNKVLYSKLRKKLPFPDLETFIDASLDYVSFTKQNLRDHLTVSVTVINEVL